MTNPATSNGELANAKRDAQLIGRVYGNIHMEYPQVTREMVAARLQLRRDAEPTQHAPKRT